MEQIEILIGKISKCNLSKEDKLSLTVLLQTQQQNKRKGKKVNFTQFIKRFFLVIGISKECMNYFDIDILEFIKQILE